jgi:hypothetical protein
MTEGHRSGGDGTGFGIGLATVHRYIREAVDLLATQAPDLRQVVQAAARFWYLILDGTLVRTDRIADDRPYYSGNTSATASTCRSSPTRAAGCCGPHQPCPAPRTTKGAPRFNTRV